MSIAAMAAVLLMLAATGVVFQKTGVWWWWIAHAALSAGLVYLTADALGFLD